MLTFFSSNSTMRSFYLLLYSFHQVAMRMRYLQGSRTSYPVGTGQCLDSPQVVVSDVLLSVASRYVWFLKGVVKQITMVIVWERAEGYLGICDFLQLYSRKYFTWYKVASGGKDELHFTFIRKSSVCCEYWTQNNKVLPGFKPWRTRYESVN